MALVTQTPQLGVNVRLFRAALLRGTGASALPNETAQLPGRLQLQACRRSLTQQFQVQQTCDVLQEH